VYTHVDLPCELCSKQDKVCIADIADHRRQGSTKSSSSTRSFNFLEKSYLQSFLQRKFLEVLPLAPPSFSAQHADSARIESFILGPLASKPICYAALAYEFGRKDNDRITSLAALDRCLETIESLVWSKPPTVEVGYARWLVIKVSFELRLPVDRCLRYILDFSRTLQVLRRFTGELSEWERVWMDNSELYYLHQLWNRFTVSLSSPVVESLEILELLMQPLEDSLSPQRSRLSWLEKRRVLMLLRCYLAFFLIRMNVSLDEITPVDRDCQRKVDITLDSIIPPLERFLQSEYVESIPLRESPYESAKIYTQPITKSVDGNSVSVQHEKEILDALSHYFIANLIIDTCLERLEPPDVSPTIWATALCRVVSTRNEELFCEENIRDLFLAGLFSSKFDYAGTLIPWFISY